ncbi:hypothetical protein ACFE04_002011 [Oxalis oulophora]
MRYAAKEAKRLLSDISRSEAKIERLETQVQVKDREIATISRTEAKNSAAFKAQIEKLQQERGEFQKIVLDFQGSMEQGCVAFSLVAVGTSNIETLLALGCEIRNRNGYFVVDLLLAITLVIDKGSLLISSV